MNVIRKGDQLIDASGATYTVTKMQIKEQRVSLTKQVGDAVETIQMPASEWKTLQGTRTAAIGADVGEQTRRSQPSVGHSVAVAELPGEGDKFVMADNSVWKIVEVGKGGIIAENEKTEAVQAFTKKEFAALWETKNFKSYVE